MPFFIVDDGGFKFTKRFLLNLLYERFGKLFRVVFTQNAEMLDKVKMDDEELGAIVGLTLGDAIRERVVDSTGMIDADAAERYRRFIEGLLHGYNENARIWNNEVLKANQRKENSVDH